MNKERTDWRGNIGLGCFWPWEPVFGATKDATKSQQAFAAVELGALSSLDNANRFLPCQMFFSLVAMMDVVGTFLCCKGHAGGCCMGRDLECLISHVSPTLLLQNIWDYKIHLLQAMFRVNEICRPKHLEGWAVVPFVSRLSQSVDLEWPIC